MKVSGTKPLERSRKDPGFWSTRLLNQLQKEYRELDDGSVPLSEFKKQKKLSRREFDELNPIIYSFMHFNAVFGGDNLGRAIGDLVSRSEGNEGEHLARIAHFFYQLGRRHERAVFK